jgi:hypothetical protein
MKNTPRFLFTASLLLATAFPAFAKIERVVEKTFTVQPGGTLHLETQGGNITVQPSTDGLVKITAKEKIRADTEAEADDLLKDLTLTLEQQGNNVSGIAKLEKPTVGFRWGSTPVQVDFVVTAPASFVQELRTSGGDIVLGDFNAKVHARTSGGDIKLGKQGAEVEASTSGGNVSLVEGSAAVKLGTSGGDITVGKVTGPADLSTSGGNIKIESVQSSIRAHTSGGDIRAGIFGKLTDDSSLTTSGGRVKVTLDKAAAFRLDASTSGGDVEADGLTITIERGGRGKSRLAGTVNGGGPLLKLRSSGGDVIVATN